MFNDYNEPITHEDCINNGENGIICGGDMTVNENINTGKYHLYCAKHSLIAYKLQEDIHHDYLNATTL